ncbi:hypothetical protein BpHYR1_050670 [Brachionus plicatilis]|uniref:Uncharacterized protein n=1 Tax=Brachionus plicatilis TaxID=10195 RepID=A0A3M7SMH2_BRAPC|nr:hypothetical protein BpHYR1_050670 [Brachionus plicatilis]
MRKSLCIINISKIFTYQIDCINIIYNTLIIINKKQKQIFIQNSLSHHANIIILKEKDLLHHFFIIKTKKFNKQNWYLNKLRKTANFFPYFSDRNCYGYYYCMRIIYKSKFFPNKKENASLLKNSYAKSKNHQKLIKNFKLPKILGKFKDEHLVKTNGKIFSAFK